MKRLAVVVLVLAAVLGWWFSHESRRDGRAERTTPGQRSTEQGTQADSDSRSAADRAPSEPEEPGTARRVPVGRPRAALPVTLRAVDRGGFDIPTVDLKSMNHRLGIRRQRVRTPYVISPGLPWLSISAPGFAETTIAIDHAAGGEHVAVLSRAGRLRVRLDGRAAAYVMIDGPHGLRRGEAKNGRCHFDALTPGRYTVEAEGAGSVSVDVLPDTTAQATLRFVSAAPAETIAVRGALRIPASWGEVKPKIRWKRRLAAMTYTNGGMAAVNGPEFSIEKARAGRIRFILRPFGMIIERAVDAATPSLLFDIPEPMNVAVEVVYATTGKPATLQSLTWRRGDYAAVVHNGRFRAAAGTVTIHARGQDVYATQTVTLSPGSHTARMPVHRFSLLDIRLRDGDRELPLLERHPVHLDGPGHTYGSAGTALRVTAPGTYKVLLDPHPVFRPIPEQTVELREGKTTRLVIDVRRHGAGR